MKEYLDWEIGVGDHPDRYVPATVPGACQLDIARSEQYPDWHYADNYRQFRWMEDVRFAYRARFRAPERKAGESLWLVSKGVDYACRILLNGKELATHEGAMSPIEVCLEEALEAENLLEVIVAEAPKKNGVPEGREQAADCCKPPVSYGWDWHPRLIPSGIWDETFLEVRARASLGPVHIRYTLSEDFQEARLALDAPVSGEGNDTLLTFSLFDNRGNCVFLRTSDEGLDGTLRQPELWWTWDQGNPYLYVYKIVLTDRNGQVLDRRVGHIGFRRVRLVMNEGAWDRPAGSPKSRSDAPVQVELNGRRIFVRGANWVAPDVFPGTVEPARYQSLTDLALQANFNLLRGWGGCLPGKDAFYEMCDAKGLLVWQEFPLSCNRYPDAEDYLNVLEQEARALVTRLWNHPCLAIWCGGNELFNAWSGMDDQALPLRLLNKICLDLMPEIPFLATSPLCGMAHGNYLFRDGDREIFQWMPAAENTAYVEFGVPSLAPQEALARIIPPEELFPVRPTDAWVSHHAFGAWDGKPETWLTLETLRFYFGEARSLEELIAQSTLLQGEGYKAIYEEARRQKPHCSMALCWMFNEPWPTAANNSIISWPDHPKPSFEAVAAACRPRLASASFPKFAWTSGETLSFRLWWLDDTFEHAIGSLEIKAFLLAPNGERTQLGTWKTPPTRDNTNLSGPDLHVTLPVWRGADWFSIQLWVSGHDDWNSTYTLAYRISR